MKELPLISVIVPVFNGEKYVAQCIENLLYQSYKHLEIIIINDGSTDHSEAIASKYPVCIINQANQGLSAARNAGMNAATGDYIHFFDVDDLINTDFYQEMLNAVTFADADMACSGVVYEKGYQNNIYDECFIAVNADDKITLCKVWTQGFVWKYLFKKSFLVDKKLEFHLGRLIEDMAFSLQAVFWANKVVFVPHALYYYKYRQNSILTNNNKTYRKKRDEDYKFARRFCLDFAKEHDLTILEEQVDWIQYKLLGIPIMKKRMSKVGKTHWLLFGIYALQRKVL
ncbi:MAG: glycosyltransferase [Candidatus Symbiothrix sp.]|jgi:glycosyltransferase involved in cell wall biosynthesis|nr:glycosyltransferase [Candidatus Symbiothrix sp.]